MAENTQINRATVNDKNSKAAAHANENNDLNTAQIKAFPPPLQFVTDSDLFNNDSESNDTESEYRAISTNIFSDGNKAVPLQKSDDGEVAANQIELDIPFGISNTNICQRAAFGLYAFQNRLKALVNEIEENDEYNADTSVLADQAEQYTAVISRLAERGEEVLSVGEVIVLQSFINGAKYSYDEIFGGYRSFMLRSANQISRAREIDPMTEELAEAKRQAFESRDRNQLENIKKIMDSVKDYNSKVRDYLQYAGIFSNRIRNSENLQNLRSAAGTVATVADNASKVLQALNIIANVTTNRSNSDLHQSINTFQNALDAIDFGMSFVKAVPVFGAIWSRYIYPVSSQCLTLLSSIATVKNKERRLLMWISNNWNSTRPPNISSGLTVAFPGEQHVFSFMWNIFMGNYQHSSNAEEFFVERESLFNAGTRSKLETERHGFLWLSKRAKNLERWAVNNKEDIWFMLYGADLPFPGDSSASVSIDSYNSDPGQW